MLRELTVDEKRELIYVGERLKTIGAEIATLSAERDTFAEAPASDEDERRRRIYVAERLVRLGQERDGLLARRESLIA